MGKDTDRVVVVMKFYWVALEGERVATVILCCGIGEKRGARLQKMDTNGKGEFKLEMGGLLARERLKVYTLNDLNVNASPRQWKGEFFGGDEGKGVGRAEGYQLSTDDTKGHEYKKGP